MFSRLALLEKIKQRPELYLGRKSLELLKVFLTGCDYAQIEFLKVDGRDVKRYVKFNKEKDAPCFDDFVTARYHGAPYLNVFQVIEMQCASEEEAFDLFFELLDEFSAEGNSS